MRLHDPQRWPSWPSGGEARLRGRRSILFYTCLNQKNEMNLTDWMDVPVANLPKRIGEIMVVNLVRSRQRLSTFKARNSSILPHFSVFEATDGKSAAYRDVSNYLVDDTKNKEDIIGGTNACFTSHIRAWHEISLRDDDMSHIVIEDDVILNKDFIANLHILIDQISLNDAYWDMIYLGNVAKKNAKKSFGTFYAPSDMEKKGVNTGWLCNVLRPKGARKLLDHIKPAKLHTAMGHVKAGDHFIKRAFKHMNVYMVFDTSLYVHHDWDVPSDRTSSNLVGVAWLTAGLVTLTVALVVLCAFNARDRLRSPGARPSISNGSLRPASTF